MENNLEDLQIRGGAEAHSGRLSPLYTTTVSTDNYLTPKSSSLSTAEYQGAAVGIQEVGTTCMCKEIDGFMVIFPSHLLNIARLPYDVFL